jgi:CRP/FNR family transcriptional regulator
MMELKEIALFKDLEDADLQEIEPYVKRTSFSKKAVIFTEGDSPEHLYFVTKGKVKITKLSQDGKEIILEIIAPFDFFGGVAVLQGFPYPANAVAMENTDVLNISRKHLLRIMDRFPNLMYSLAMNIGERMRGSHESLKNIALERVESRIASLLLKLAEKMGEKTDDGISIGMRLTKQDLADMVGTTVETSIRVMTKFKKSGYIIEKEGKVVLTDPEGLSSIGS